jgi:hypothetical protein
MADIPTIITGNTKKHSATPPAYLLGTTRKTRVLQLLGIYQQDILDIFQIFDRE